MKFCFSVHRDLGTENSKTVRNHAKLFMNQKYLFHVYKTPVAAMEIVWSFLVVGYGPCFIMIVVLHLVIGWICICNCVNSELGLCTLFQNNLSERHHEGFCQTVQVARIRGKAAEWEYCIPLHSPCFPNPRVAVLSMHFEKLLKIQFSTCEMS